MISDYINAFDELGHWPKECREVAAQLLRNAPPVVLITGKAGSGRSSFLGEVATELRKNNFHLHQFTGDEDPSELLPDQLSVLAQDSVVTNTVIAIDDFDRLAGLTGHTVDHQFLAAIDEHARKHELRFLLTVEEQYAARLAELHQGLANITFRMNLPELSESTLRDIVRSQARQLVRARISPEVLDLALASPLDSDHMTHPKLALSRIDAGVRRANLAGAKHLQLTHMELSGARVSPANGQEIEEGLNTAIHGQQGPISTIAKRLAPALAGLKLRPDRPHAVFLFAGPSGVGKTQTAKELARIVYGSEEALIRLDMSEFADERDARMKLIGGSRIWRDSTTDGLLTTRVRERPRSVVLLDEFEKSHPSIWSLFLQIFDDGRLTDGWGNTASFAETVIVMTSNLGAREGNSRTAGFGSAESFDSQRQEAVITAELPTELQGRITDIVFFSPLSFNALKRVADNELRRAAEILTKKGLQLEYDTETIEWLAQLSMRSAGGARYLQQFIESEVFPRAIAAGRTLSATVKSQELSFEAVYP